MGTIVDKFNYSFEAKDLIKDSINNLGGSITSETELKEYAQELDNIYDNLPKTTGEDTSLSLTTLKGKMNIIPKGDTQQDSATGSNLMNTEKLVNGTYNGLTITKDSDDFINISGTATANTSIVLSEITYNFPSTLYISYENTFATSTAQLTFFNGSTTLGGLTFSGANRTYNMSTILGDKTCTRIELYVANGNTINGKFRPMLNTQSGQPYSKYAFPNPSYPQDIEVVTGTQEVKVENVNLLKLQELTTQTNNGVTFTPYYENGELQYININGTATNTAAYNLQGGNVDNASTFPCSIKQGGYTLSGYLSSTNNYKAIYLRYTYDNSTFTTISATTKTSVTFTQDCKIASYLRIQSGQTCNNEKVYPQLEKRKCSNYL